MVRLRSYSLLAPRAGGDPSGENWLYHFTAHIGKPEVAPGITIRQLFVIDVNAS